MWPAIAFPKMQHFLGFAHEKALISHVLQNQGMGGEGLNNDDVNANSHNELRESHEQGEAYSEAVWSEIDALSDSSNFDYLRRALVNVDLQSIVLAWADLPVDARYHIMEIVQAEQWKRQAAQAEHVEATKG